MTDQEKFAGEQKRELYEKQVKMLKLFLEKHAISQAQYDKSFHDLTEKMGFSESETEIDPDDSYLHIG